MQSIQRILLRTPGVTGAEGLILHHVFSVQPLGALLQLKLDFAAVGQAPVAVHLNRRVVDEHVFTGRPLDKAIPFGRVEPFDSAFFLKCSHSPLLNRSRNRRQANREET